MSAAEHASRWRHRARVAEAGLLLAASRALIAVVPFRHWRGWLGAMANVAPPHSRPLAEPAALRSRRVARAVGQAAKFLPGQSLCLPRALAACWMLRRRSIPCALVIGVADSRHRGTLDDLHAWVSCGAQVIVGEGEQFHAPILVLRETA